MKTTLLLVDDHQLFREGLKLLIEQHQSATVVGEAGSGIEAIRLVEKLRPDLVLMDLNMPDMNGIDATRQIVKKYPATKILALSMECDRFFVVEVLKAGAAGYLLKDSAFAELSQAIASVAKGETYLPQKVSKLLVKEFLQCIPEEQTLVYDNLTPREREVLQLISDGKSTKEIAHLLGISHKTVENQRQSIMHKLQLFNVAELTKFAVRHGLSSLTK